MILVLTMAGRYTRFINEGFKFPKYLLPWSDRTILSKIIGEMSKGDAFSNIYLIANARDEAYMPHVRAIMRSYDINVDNLFLIPDTKGQAETASVGLDFIEGKMGSINESIVFHNIDTILYKRDYAAIKSALSNNDGYIDVFGSNHHEYSYVLEDDKNRVCEIAEKIVISELATSGLYGFKNPDTFRELYDNNEDLYISSIYKNMIEHNKEIVTGSKHSEHDTVVLGTPEEYINASVMIDNEQH